MATWSEVPLKMMSSARRFDAEFFRPEYLEIEKTIRATGHFLPLGSICTRLFAKGIFDIKAEEYVDEGVPFVRITNLRNCTVDQTGMAYLTSERSKKDSKTELTYGDIVLSKTAIPAASFVQVARCNVSQDIIAVKTDRSPEFNSFLVLFLNSKYGLPELGRRFRGNIQAHLGLHEARGILVPIPDERFIADLARLFSMHLLKHELSVRLYDQASLAISESLGLESLRFPPSLGYGTKLSQAVAANRWDAQYFRPKYQVLLDAVRRAPFTRHLSQMITYNARGVQPEYVANGPVAVVTSQHLGPRHVSYDQLERTSEEAFAMAARAHIRKGDVLVYTTGAYVGRTTTFLSGERAMASNHVNILRLRPEYDSAYVGAVLNSSVGLLQTERHASGTAQAELYPDGLARFLIPILKREEVQKIGERVRESYEAMIEAKSILDHARRMVEDYVEAQAAGQPPLGVRSRKAS